ncbi:MAG: hypothetical protein ACR2QT_03070 [Woeseiaceae bacterium]
MSNAIGPKPYRARALDELVATYAPKGAQRKRRQFLRRSVIAAGGTVAVVLVGFLSVSGLSLIDRLGKTGPQLVAGMSDAERIELAEKLASLEARIAGAQTHKRDLEAQLAEFEAQSLRLASLLADIDTEQATLQTSEQQGSQLDQEIAAMATQRATLEKRWAQFEAQGELLAMEIMAVNAQRKELESQRQLIQLQRQQLADMLQEADVLYRRHVRAAEAETTQDANSQDASTRTDEDEGGEDAFIHTSNSLMVNNAELDGLRGGFSIGDGMDIAFGFTQTGSINGVDQFSNSFSVDSVASGFDDVDMSNMNSVVLQNGSGNFVSMSVLDALSDSFGNVIQNTLDDQVISTTTTFDISLQNMPGTLQGLAGEMALMDTLGSF